MTGVWGDQLSSESESTSEDEDEGDDAIVDLEEEGEEENEEEDGEASGPHDEIISDEELLEDPHVTYNSIEEEREANAAKKAAAREAREAAEEEAKEVSSDEEKEGKKKDAYVKFWENDINGFVTFGDDFCGGFYLGNERSDSYCADLSRGFEGLEDTTLTGKNWERPNFGEYHHCTRLVAIQFE